jgi:hypothetical protein
MIILGSDRMNPLFMLVDTGSAASMIQEDALIGDARPARGCTSELCKHKWVTTYIIPITLS